MERRRERIPRLTSHTPNINRDGEKLRYYQPRHLVQNMDLLNLSKMEDLQFKPGRRGKRIGVAFPSFRFDNSGDTTMEFGKNLPSIRVFPAPTCNRPLQRRDGDGKKDPEAPTQRSIGVESSRKAARTRHAWEDSSNVKTKHADKSDSNQETKTKKIKIAPLKEIYLKNQKEEDTPLNRTRRIVRWLQNVTLRPSPRDFLNNDLSDIDNGDEEDHIDKLPSLLW